MKRQLRGSLYLLTATVIWGSAFIAQSVGMDLVGPITFQAVRCTLAALALLPVIYLFNPKEFFALWKNPKLWKTGLGCGIALFLAVNLQQIGIVYTDAGKAGFITAMYIVLVPVVGLAFRKKPSVSALISIGIAVVGLYLLSCVGVTQINKGDVYLMGCALAFAIQITLVDQYASDLDCLRLNCIQSLVCGILSLPFMFALETPAIENILQCWLPIGYAGILSMGAAYSLQILGQKDLEPTAASLIMSLESVFAALFGWLLLKETMTIPETLGSLLIFLAVIFSQVPIKKKKIKEVA